MRHPRFAGLTVVAAVALVWASVGVAEPGAASAQWITLGTQGGPVAGKTRSQSSNVLRYAGKAFLVDVGDGTAEQLAKASIPLASVDAVFLSHLHFDHVGGLQAVLGMRYQTDLPGVLTIYGPPGTKALVDGIVASMMPAAAEGFGLPQPKTQSPNDGVKVVELAGGGVARIGGLSIRAVENNHYSTPPGTSRPRGVSLSYRFDTPGRSIAYTGDTGPSAAVDQMAMGADMLVAEMVDVTAFRAEFTASRPNLPAVMLDGVVQQLETHHLTPARVGELAGRAKVSELVITHLIPGDLSAEAMANDRSAIARSFHGRVVLAKDLDVF